MTGEPKQQPRRPRGFFEGVMLDMRVAALRAELSPQEQVTVAASYLGLAIAAMDISVESQIEVMAAVAKITHTACMSRTAVKQGAAWPMQTKVLGPGGVRQ